MYITNHYFFYEDVKELLVCSGVTKLILGTGATEKEFHLERSQMLDGLTSRSQISFNRYFLCILLSITITILMAGNTININDTEVIKMKALASVTEGPSSCLDVMFMIDRKNLYSIFLNPLLQ